MRHLVMDKPQCLLYSAAMVLGIDIEDITDILGHDGMEKVDDQPSPCCYRGVHIQEIQTIAYRLGYLFAPVEVVPVSQRGTELSPIYNISGMDYSIRFHMMTRHEKGIIFGPNARGNEHAVAFEDDTIYDPMGTKYPIGQYKVREAWVLR